MARDLRLFYVFRLLSTSYLFVPVRVAYLQASGMSMTQVFYLALIYTLGIIVTEFPTGLFADRFGRRASMACGALAMVASCTTFFLADGFAWFAFAEVLAALSMSLCSGADSAYLFDLLDEHDRGHEYARREGSASAWHMIGQALAFAAGGLLGEQNLAWPYLATAVWASLAFVAALFMRRERAQSRISVNRGSPADVVQAFRLVARRPRLRWGVAYSAAVFMLLMAMVYIYQPLLKESGYGIATTGFVFAGLYVLGALVAHHADHLRRRAREQTLVFALIATLVVTCLVLGLLPGGGWVIAVLALQQMANGLYSPLVKPILNREIDDSRQRATVLSVESMVRRSAFLVATIVLGWTMDRWGASGGMLVCAALGGLAAVSLYSASPFREKSPASAAPVLQKAD